MKLSSIKYFVPSGITFIRLLAAPLFYYVFLHGLGVIAFMIFSFAALTDIFDGYAARKLDAVSHAGAFLDASADFFLIIVVFIAFFKRSWYDFFVLIPIVISFIIFIVSSGRKELIYDPVGKYLGAFLMLMITITLLIPYPTIMKILTYLLVVLFMVSIVTRILYLTKKV